MPFPCKPRSLNEATSVIGRRIDMPNLNYVQFGYEEAARGMRKMGISGDVSRLFVEMSKALNEGRFAVGRLRTSNNTMPTSIEEFALTFAEAFTASTQRKAASCLCSQDSSLQT